MPDILGVPKDGSDFDQLAHPLVHLPGDPDGVDTSSTDRSRVEVLRILQDHGLTPEPWMLGQADPPYERDPL